MSSPRQQHYRFAHTILAGRFLRDPAGFWQNLETLGGVALREPWEEAGKELDQANLVTTGAPSLQNMSPAPDVQAFVISMPPPERPTECHFIALVRVGQGPARYFVAENGIDDGAGPRAYWAEWKSAPGGGGVMRVRGADLPAIAPQALLDAAVQEIRSAPPEGPAASPFGPQAGPGPFGPQAGAGPFGPQAGPGAFGAPGGQGAFGAPGAGGPFGPPGAPGPGGMGMRPLPGQPAKKSRLPMILGCGCLGIFLFVLTVGGTLLYYEEGKGLHVPDTEVASMPVAAGSPYSVDFVWDGTGYAFNNVWLVVDEGQKAGGQFEVDATFRCNRGGREEKKTIKLTSYGGEAGRRQRHELLRLDLPRRRIRALPHAEDHVLGHGHPHTRHLDEGAHRRHPAAPRRLLRVLTFPARSDPPADTAPLSRGPPLPPSSQSPSPTALRRLRSTSIR
ncbi:MAG: hypothetical protein R3F14_23915 [Polyangiaceae bacterium]